MKRIKNGLVAISAVALGAICVTADATPAFADAHANAAEAQKPHKWEFGLFGGYHWFSEDNELGVEDTPDTNNITNSWGFGLRLGYTIMDYLSAEAEVSFMPTDTRDIDAMPPGTETDVMPVHFKLQAVGHVLPATSSFRPFVLAGFGLMVATASDTRVVPRDTDPLFHAGLGVKMKLSDRLGLRADARLLLPPSSEGSGVTTDFAFWVGFGYAFGGGDKAAPPPPPPEPKDSDGDGLMDDADKCPNDAEDKDGFEDDDGCPDKDNDGDGIPDETDKCPMDAETINNIDDEDGCPEGDEDGDGIVGSADQCPTEPEDKDNFKDEDGCPDPDNDGDGVLDANDQCEGELETKNGFKDDDGCPDTVPKIVAKFSGAIRGIRFASGKAVIRRSSFRTLDEAVKVLTQYKSIKLEIQGHTDSQGDDAFNQKLSQDRADAVMAYMVSKGIDASRLSAKGYGETVPIADNKKSSGRAINRRVEFKREGDTSGAAAPKKAP